MKTEKEKMEAGELYNTKDPEIIELYHQAQKLIHEYTNTSTRDYDKKSQILDSLLGKKGKDVWIEAPFACDYGKNIFIGDSTFINFNCVFLDCGKITIGSGVLIAPGVQIYAVGHPTDPLERIKKDVSGQSDTAFYETFTQPVIIGNNVWIGGGSIVLGGVSIGDNVTIGAGSVVTKSIPANSIAVGNPCRVIKTINIP